MNFEQNKHFTDTTFFDSGGMMFYEWNCDSTWLVFENHTKVILKSCSKVDPVLCSRVGLSFIEEYPQYLLFTHSFSSGYCQAPEIVLLDKLIGNELVRISSEDLIYADMDNDFILYFIQNSVDSLVCLDLNTDVKIIKTVQEGVENSSFSNFKFENSQLSFDIEESTGDFSKMTIDFK